MKIPEKYRVDGIKHENNGVFIIPHIKIYGYFYCAIASDGEGWEHVSVTLRDNRKRVTKEVKRSCTWLEMCCVKSMFWDDEDAVMQIHAPMSEWVSTHPYCLHLWKPTKGEFPRPPQILVGIPGDNVQS